MVSMPYDGLFSFLHDLCIYKKIKKGGRVSMPYDGLFSFLLTGRQNCTSTSPRGVNALWRAFFISTVPVAYNDRYNRRCQCPMTGFFHFYGKTDGKEKSLRNSVNALWRAFFISTHAKFCIDTDGKSVNALWRAFFISTRRTGRSRIRTARRCQCPMTGFFHFYTMKKMYRIVSYECQCPMTGFFHFYEAARVNAAFTRTCVNALWRAFFISTGP